ncbi:MAG: LysR substrate-binding domain-containing protein [Pseudomonadota bacterium]|jgi:DNA-binding transcriptional LysR family regulator
MPEPDWNRLRSFALVVRHGSIARAAANSLSTQPTLSRHIRELEEELGLQLFTRSRTGLALTSLGTEIYEKTRLMSEAALGVMNLADGQSEEIGGSVRVAASVNIARHLLPGVLAPILIEHPQLAIELVASDAVENLLERDADIAVRMFQPEQQDLIARRLGELEVGMYATPAYLARRGTPATLADVLDHDFVGYDRQMMAIRGFREAGLAVQRDFFRFRCDDEGVAWELVRQGFGIGPAPVLFAQGERDLVRLFEDAHLRSLPVWLVAHAEVRTSARVRLVFDRLAEGIRKTLAVSSESLSAQVPAD